MMAHGTAMTNDEYKQRIKEMLDQIEDNNGLRVIYAFTVKYYLHADTKCQEVHS